MIYSSTLDFLSQLKNNNDRKWFSENKESYQIARKNFIDLFDDFAGKLVFLDDNLSNSVEESHIFRLNRDVRFSNNKQPYKYHFGAYICPGGKANMDIRACYYLHIEPGNSFIGGGAYMPGKEYLEKIRERIANKGYELEEILKNPEFEKYYTQLSQEYMLKTAPRGYPKDHPYISLLRYKSFSTLCNLSDEQVLSDNFLGILLERAIAIKPLNDCFNNIYI